MLGREVCRTARRRGLTVLRASRAPAEGDAVVFDAERDDPRSLFRSEVDLVVNCAAVLAPDVDPSDPASLASAERVNAVFPHALAEAAAEAEARLVHISTDGVFAADAGECSETSVEFSDDAYGSSKRRGEPLAPNALSVRTSFVGLDPVRHRGLLEWLLSRPDGSRVPGFTDQSWNGVVSTQLASACAFLADRALFERARAEGPVHHLHENPRLTKYELLELCRAAFAKDVTIDATDSGAPVTRVLTTVHSVLVECLKSEPTRDSALRALAARRDEEADR